MVEHNDPTPSYIIGQSTSLGLFEHWLQTASSFEILRDIHVISCWYTSNAEAESSQ
jgi:hypothetical protein